MFQKINNCLTNIPVFLIWEYCFLFTLRNTDWYAKNANWIDDIDNYVVFFAIIHFVAYVELYSEKQLKYCISLVLIVLLQLWALILPESWYFFLYLLIILYPILF